MGTTFVDFRGKGFEASDGALAVWLELLVKAIDQVKPLPEWLEEVRDEWHLQATAGFGFGVMPGLDRYLTDDERRDTILRLGTQAMSQLESHGALIPRETLNALGTGGEGAYFPRDVPATIFIQTARYFIKLLQGTLRKEERDSRFEAN